MSVPTQAFGGGSDGALRMESWLWEMCAGCAHETRPEARGSGERLAGMDCRLPAQAYLEPYDDLLEWSVDADPAGPMGVRCMAFEPRLTPEQIASRPEGQLAGQQTLTVSA